MNINLQIDEEDEPIRRRTMRPAPDYLSRSFRLRLLTLFAALVLVLVLMKEAGKPERWAWMGFDQQPAAEADTGTADRAGDAEPADLVTAKPIVPAASQKFWSDFFKAAKPTKRKQLFQLFRSIEIGQPVAADQQLAFASLWREVIKRREVFDLAHLETLTRLEPETVARQQAADRSYEARDFWEQKIKPAIEDLLAGRDGTVAGQQAVIRLATALESAVWDVVLDGTAVGHPADAVAWSRIWEQVVSSTGADRNEAVSVDRVQLMSQPRQYRGCWVSVSGWVRLARCVNRPISVLDAHRKKTKPSTAGYYELWLRPEDTSAGPFCVYARQLPKDFPEVTQSYTEPDQRVNVTGVFFKNRNYVAADSTTSVCPFLIAKSVAVVQTVAEVQQSSWRPDGLTFALIVGVLALLAAGIAWLARKTALTPRYQPGEQTRQRISQSLDSFRDDPDIMTDREKISGLRQHLDDTSEASTEDVHDAIPEQRDV